MMCSLELNTSSARTSWGGNEKVLLEIPVSQGDKEHKSKLEVSNPYLRQQLKGFCRDEGWEMDSSIDHLGIKKKERALGDWEKGVNKERDLEKEGGCCHRMLEVFLRQYLTTGRSKNSSLWALCHPGSGGTRPSGSAQLKESGSGQEEASVL